MKTDRSKKGSFDEDIKPLLEVINSKEGYTTTSSCSGRIVILDIPKAGDKKNARWLYTTHEKADAEKIIEILNHIKKPVWLLQEPVILHVKCNNLDHAEALLKTAQDCGFKRSGIFSLKNNAVELQSTERIETLLTPGLDEKYVRLIVDAAQKKLDRTKEKIKRLEMKLLIKNENRLLDHDILQQ